MWRVKQGDKTYTDTSDEIVIKDGTDEGDTTLKDAARAAATLRQTLPPGRHAGAGSNRVCGRCRGEPA